MPHLKGKIVEGGVVGAGAAAKMKLLLIRGLRHFHPLADRRELTTLICSAGDAREMGRSD